jgi:hypothetical protein
MDVTHTSHPKEKRKKTENVRDGDTTERNKVA